MRVLCFFENVEGSKIRQSHVESERFLSCKYCGRIHAEGHIYSKKPIKHKKIDEAVKFRNSSGYYPDEFYSYSPTYELNYNVLTQKFNSNTDMLDFYEFICKN